VNKGTEILTPKSEFQCQYSSSWCCRTKIRRKNGDIRSEAGRGVHDRLHRHPEIEGLASLAFNETISQFCLLIRKRQTMLTLEQIDIAQRGFTSEIALWNFSDQKQTNNFAYESLRDKQCWPKSKSYLETKFCSKRLFTLEISLWNFSDQKQPDRSGQGKDHHHLKNVKKRPNNPRRFSTYENIYLVICHHLSVSYKQRFLLFLFSLFITPVKSLYTADFEIITFFYSDLKILHLLTLRGGR
jgi:hypothetical protein